MSELPHSELPSTPRATIQQYLDATAAASDRSRYVTVTMVVACLFVLVAAFNSMQGWMRRRIQIAADPTSAYVTSKIGNVPTDREERAAYDRRYQALYGAMVGAYVESAFSLKVPVFGFAFDANDLGIFGGMAFVALMGMAIYCLERELYNLRLSFASFTGAELHQFYTLLAMRQVFTIPPTGRSSATHVLSAFPKVLWALPLAIHVLVTLNDYSGKWIYDALKAPTETLIAWEILFTILLIPLTILVFWRLIAIDNEWQNCHRRLMEEPGV